MAAAKKATKKAAKKSSSKKATAKKASSKKATAKKTAAKKATSKKATTKKATKKPMAPAATVVVASQTRETVRGADIRMASDFPDALNAEVHHLIERAVQRAKDNGRGTVRPSDL